MKEFIYRNEMKQIIHIQRNEICICSHLVLILHWESEMKWNNEMGVATKTTNSTKTTDP